MKKLLITIISVVSLLLASTGLLNAQETASEDTDNDNHVYLPLINQGESHFAQSSAVSTIIMSIALGSFHTCALTSSGGVKCWGYNFFGALGDGTTTSSFTPVDVSGLSSGVVAIAAGDEYTCALTSGGGVKCWGLNNLGQLGDGTTTDRLTPVDVSGLSSGVIAISDGGLNHTCALTSGGGVKCWGNNGTGQLGDGTTTQHLTPVDVSGLSSGVISIATDGFQTCALTGSGGVKCWGYNYYGALGDGTTMQRLTPVDVNGLSSGVIAIATGINHTCALTSSGGVKCWGYNYYGALGDGTTTDHLTPVDVSGLSSGVIAIAAGDEYTCALTSGGGVKCWGFNHHGQLGDGTTTQRLTPVDVSGLSSGVIDIANGELYHTCALTSGGGVKCWGNNVSGQLGDGTTTERLTPVDVIGLGGGTLTYSISGRVTDANNAPISDVAISDGAGHTTTTDSNGNYALSPLATGIYTLTPSKASYTFSPPSSSPIAVPPDAIEVNFVLGGSGDSDGDGLLDDWETKGLTVTVGGGEEFVNLPLMGADRNHRDIFVEIDWMGPEISGGHTHHPDASAIQMIVDAFNNAGIHLHVDYGSDAPLTWGSSTTWGTLSHGEELPHQTYVSTCTGDSFNWNGIDTIKQGHLTPGRAAVFHYNVWAHSLCTTKEGVSGISRNPDGAAFGSGASDFIVSLGGWTNPQGTPNEQAGTFMHELGHNLGLRHGGEDHTEWKPNYLSVMNYAFQTRGLIINSTDGHFDYSRYDLADLNENSLTETVGISLSASITNILGTIYFCGLDDMRPDTDARRVDWNCDGDDNDTGVIRNINQGVSWNNNSTLDNPLTSQIDWNNLVFTGGAISQPGATVSLPETSEVIDIDVTEDADIPPFVFADLSLIKTDNPDPVTAGQNLTYDLTVINNGPSDATRVNLVDNLPAEVTFVSATSGQGSCNEVSETVTCNLGTLTNGTSVSVTIVVTANSGPTITNTASVTANETDTNTANNNVSVNTTVNPAPTSTLTVVKHVINNNGGTKAVSDFPLAADSNPVTSGVATTVAPGTHTVSEQNLPGYTATFSGDCNASGQVTVNAGESKTCTITNDDQPGSITIVKDAVPDDPQDFAFSSTLGNFMLDDDPSNNTLSNQATFANLSSGGYTVSETAANGWNVTAISCNDGDSSGNLAVRSATVNLQLGESVTCTFTNQRQTGTVVGMCGGYTIYQTGSVYSAPGWNGTIKVGTSVNNTINGSSGADLILGLGGNDKLYGKGGDDVICGGDGNDLIEGAAGNDNLEGGNGNDLLRGEKGDYDVLLGGAGNDGLFDPDGVDGIHGGAGIDVLTFALRKGWRDRTGAARFDQKLSGGYQDDVVLFTILDRSTFFIDITGDERDNPPAAAEGHNDTLGLVAKLDPASKLLKFEHSLIKAADVDALDQVATMEQQYATEYGFVLKESGEEDAEQDATQNNHLFLPFITR